MCVTLLELKLKVYTSIISWWLHFKSILMVNRGKITKIMSLSKYLWTWLHNCWCGDLSFINELNMIIIGKLLTLDHALQGITALSLWVVLNHIHALVLSFCFLNVCVRDLSEKKKKIRQREREKDRKLHKEIRLTCLSFFCVFIFSTILKLHLLKQGFKKPISAIMQRRQMHYIPIYTTILMKPYSDVNWSIKWSIFQAQAFISYYMPFQQVQSSKNLKEKVVKTVDDFSASFK